MPGEVPGAGKNGGEANRAFPIGLKEETMPREKKPAAIAMPILALRGLMVFPHMVLHLSLIHI